MMSLDLLLADVSDVSASLLAFHEPELIIVCVKTHVEHLLQDLRSLNWWLWPPSPCYTAILGVVKVVPHPRLFRIGGIRARAIHLSPG